MADPLLCSRWVEGSLQSCIWQLGQGLLQLGSRGWLVGWGEGRLTTLATIPSGLVLRPACGHLLVWGVYLVLRYLDSRVRQACQQALISAAAGLVRVVAAICVPGSRRCG